MSGKLRIARIYDDPSEEDGYRILADRLWPRGMKKENAHLDAWLKSAAPSNELRRQYHKDGNYDVFAERYMDELDQNEDTPALISVVKEHLKQGNVTLLSASKNINACNVSVLQTYLLERI